MAEAAACKCGADKFDPPRSKCTTTEKHVALDGYQWVLDRDSKEYHQKPTKAARKEAFDGLIRADLLPRKPAPEVKGTIGFKNGKYDIDLVMNHLGRRISE